MVDEPRSSGSLGKRCQRGSRASFEHYVPKAQAARTFGVGNSTVKRYATKVQKGESLEPGKAPGKRPKMDERVGKLLAEDLKEHPFATLRERSASTWRP